jgi:hypothetical protein
MHHRKKAAMTNLFVLIYITQNVAEKFHTEDLTTEGTEIKEEPYAALVEKGQGGR